MKWWEGSREPKAVLHTENWHVQWSFTILELSESLVTLQMSGSYQRNWKFWDFETPISPLLISKVEIETVCCWKGEKDPFAVSLSDDSAVLDQWLLLNVM